MRLFLDQDQCLADFNQAFRTITRFWPWDYKKFMINQLKAMGASNQQASEVFVLSFWDIIHRVPFFWERIPPMKDFKKLWRFVKKFDPIVLTAVPEFPEFKFMAVAGKRQWIDKYLNPDIQMLTINLNSYDHKKMDKTIYCECEDDILIDDNERNVKEWIKKGGKAIYHTDAKSTIKELKVILNVLKEKNHGKKTEIEQIRSTENWFEND